MNINKILVFGLLLLVASSCKSLVAPEFKDVKDLKVDLAGFTSVNVTGEALFYNPNSTSITIKDIELDVAVDNQKVTHISKTFDIKALGEQDFTVPIDLKLPLKDLQINSLSSAINMLSGEEKVLHFLGTIKVKAYGINFNVPIDHKEAVKLRL